MEVSIRLQRQLVKRNVRGLKADRGPDIVDGVFCNRPRQAEHQIQIEVVEPGLLRDFDRALRFARRMHPAQRLQKTVVETLNPDRQPVDPERAKLRKLLAFERAGISFERDLDIVLQLNEFRYACQ